MSKSTRTRSGRKSSNKTKKASAKLYVDRTIHSKKTRIFFPEERKKFLKFLKQNFRSGKISYSQIDELIGLHPNLRTVTEFLKTHAKNPEHAIELEKGRLSIVNQKIDLNFSQKQLQSIEKKIKKLFETK